MHIIIDTREQQPWSFPPEVAEVSRGTLSAGDYSLAGDDAFAIERKSMNDLVGTISSGWDRFLRELDRMDAMGIFPQVVIVEGAWKEILAHSYNHPQVSPAFVQSRLATLAFRGVHILFADSPHAAACMAYGLFRCRMKFLVGELFNESDNNGAGTSAQAKSSLDLPERNELDDPQD